MPPPAAPVCRRALTTATAVTPAGAAGSDPSTSYAEALETFAESLALDIIAWGKNHPELTITHLKMASLANHLEK